MNTDTTTQTRTHTVVITCPRGKTGRDVLQALSSQGVDVRPVGRSEQTPFDWTDESTWRPALSGARAAYLVYQPDLALPGAPQAIARIAAIAREEGLEHIVLLSGRNEPGAVESEQALRDSGLDWTVVTASVFAQNFTEGLFHPAIMSGVISLPAADMPEPFTDTGDIAAVVTAALTDERHRGKTYEVSGPSAVSFTEAAAEIASATGRSVRFEQVPPEAFIADLEQLGLPTEDAAGLAALFEEILDGRNRTPADGVQQALGRPARAFSEVVAEAAAHGVWSQS
ncbi:NmrA family NAD(P)-binding protein [Luteipulveratus mongoliensis]|uniref:NmrA-like domain-containing protein n=1 Tax=Luteipulveratus mongoliensis TaxID=571913 RepID=A0A0K1JQ40_9MICO|nr:NmrA family NAD(P)-binding protein [Luteipulveratus mongoliensis]AKU18837.1 hypothetical protein VV02_11215 [Luteipulveratus mongoliensis]